MSIKFIAQTDDNELSLEIANIKPSLINAIRRICLEDHETIAFNIDDYINSDIKVLKNTSGLHNEFLLHRIGLIPIHYPDNEMFDVNTYKFVLKKENKTKQMINVSSEDFEVINTETGKKENSKLFFPPNKQNSYILINKLKSNTDIGEEIHVEGKASKFSGKKNARYQPGFITFSNKQDPEKVKVALETYLEENKEKDKVQNLKKHFEISLADRYFHTDKNDDCNYFNVSVESFGVIKPTKMLLNCINILYNKLDNFKEKINKIVKEKLEDDNIKVEVSLENMKCHEITLKNETHTLGNLIQSYAPVIFNSNNLLKFIGYKNPHPLKDIIIFKIATENNTLEELNQVINITCEAIMQILTEFKKQIEKKL